MKGKSASKGQVTAGGEGYKNVKTRIWAQLIERVYGGPG